MSTRLFREYDAVKDRQAWEEYGEEKGMAKGIGIGVEKGRAEGIKEVLSLLDEETRKKLLPQLAY